MSRTAPYQWVCLRSIKTRTQLRTLATETSTPTGSESTTAEQPPPTSNSDLKSYLQTQDTAFLQTTKSHLDRIATHARSIQELATSIPRDASKIQLLKDIPPYTTTIFRRERNNPQPQVKSLLTHIEVLNNNLTDLEYTPYPSDSGPSKADKFKKKLSEWSEQEKIDEVEDLRAVEVSHAARLMRSTEGLKGHVEALETLGKGRSKNPFRKVENAGVVEDESQGEGKKVGGFGTDVKAGSGEEGKVSNPFKGSGKEKKAAGNTVKAKENKATGEHAAKTKQTNSAAEHTAKVKETKTAVDTARANNEAPTKVADAVDVPKPVTRKTLAELQADLTKNISKK